MLRSVPFVCPACLVRADDRPSCRSCGEPRVPEAARVRRSRGAAVGALAIAGIVGGLSLLVAALSEIPGATAIALVQGVCFSALPVFVLGRVVWRVLSRGPLAPLGASARRDAAGLCDGEPAVLRGRVHVLAPPLDGSPEIAVASRGEAVCAGRFEVRLEDGSAVLVDDEDVEVGSLRARDALRDAIEIREGDEVVVGGRARTLVGAADGYRAAQKRFALEGCAAEPLRIVRLGGTPRPASPPATGAGREVARVRVRVAERGDAPTGEADAVPVGEGTFASAEKAALSGRR